MASADEESPELPPYPQLIMEAIEALDDTDGSSKDVISEYIESQHKDLPAGHSTLLAHHLNKLKESGELELIDDNYKKAVSSTSKKRGRGRPRKHKDPALSGTPVTSPRPRGRPRKDPASPAPALSPKPRGRPPNPKPEGAPKVSPRPRGRPPKAHRPRGRPPKVKGESVPSKAKVKAKAKAKRSAESSAKRGRPAKKAKTVAGASLASTSKSGVKRGRGRPPKAKPDAASSD